MTMNKADEEKNLSVRIRDKQREKLKLFHADLEAVIDICTRIQRELEAMFDPPPFRPSDLRARVIKNMSEVKEAMKH